MRIRGTKPEFWKSKRIAAVSWDARLVLKGLESYVDDNGVGVDDIELVVTDVFPRDMFASPRETVARVSEAITELHQAGLVHRYEAKGEHLIFISFWESVQRIDKPGKGRFPRPDGTFAYNESEIRESIASPRESVAPVTGEQGNRGTGEQGFKDMSSPDGDDGAEAAAHTDFAYSADFLLFWDVYPRKGAKRDAFKAWKSARRNAGVSEILIGAKRYADDPNRVSAYTALPATWLNGGRWEDAPLPPRIQRTAAPDHTQRVMDTTRTMLAAEHAKHDQHHQIEAPL